MNVIWVFPSAIVINFIIIFVNAERIRDKYRQDNRDLSSEYHHINFISQFLSTQGISRNRCNPFSNMLKEVDFEKQYINFILRKLITIIISLTYYIFCMRNKPWTNLDLLIC